MFEHIDQGGGHGASLLHRCPVGFKLLILTMVSVALFGWPELWFVGLSVAVVSGLYPLAGFSLLIPFRQFQSLFWLLSLLFIFSLFQSGWLPASIIVLRLLCLFFLANLVTLTTPLSAMMACFERLFVILKPFGINPVKVALVFSLTLRFLPLLKRCVAEVRQAQAARGLERSLVASFVPVVILMLKMSEDITNAIEARGFDG